MGYIPSLTIGKQFPDSLNPLFGSFNENRGAVLGVVEIKKG